MEDVNDGNMPSIYLLKFLGLKMTQYMSLLIPISLFFGIIISLNRFYASNEIIIMKLNGYSSWSISKILSKFIIFGSLLVLLFNFFLTPFAFDQRERLQHQITHEKKIYSFKENSFNVSTDKSKVLFVNDLNESFMPNVFIKSSAESAERLDISQSISFSSENNNAITLNNGISYIFKIDGSYSTTNYLSQDILLTSDIPKFVSHNLKAKSIYELYQMDNFNSLSEGVRRISLVLATLILGFLAVPLSHVNARDDNYKNIFIASVFYFLYIISINILSKASSEAASLLLSISLMHLTFLLITVYLYNPLGNNKKR